jgi:hypothetical protein
MTDETEISDALLHDLAAALRTRAESLRYYMESGQYVDLAALSTAEEAAQALEGLSPDRWERHLIVMRWAELAPTLDELFLVHAQCACEPRMSRVQFYVETRMVMLCRTLEHLRRVARRLAPWSPAWKSIARRGLDILQNGECPRPD